VIFRRLQGTAEDKKKHQEMVVEEGWGSSFEKLDAYLEEIR